MCIHDEVDEGVDGNAIFDRGFERMVNSIQPKRRHVMNRMKYNDPIRFRHSIPNGREERDSES